MPQQERTLLLRYSHCAYLVILPASPRKPCLVLNTRRKSYFRSASPGVFPALTAELVLQGLTPRCAATLKSRGFVMSASLLAAVVSSAHPFPTCPPHDEFRTNVVFVVRVLQPLSAYRALKYRCNLEYEFDAGIS